MTTLPPDILVLIETTANTLLRRLPRSVEYDDLFQEGAIRAIQAIAQFDPGRGVPLRAYAYTAIYGGMIDYLRAINWAPRRMKQHTRIQNVSSECWRLLERQWAGHEDGTEAIDRRDEAHYLLLCCKAKHREVLAKRYLDGKTMAQVAAELGLTPKRADTLNRKGLETARWVCGVPRPKAKPVRKIGGHHRLCMSIRRQGYDCDCWKQGVA